MSETKQNMDRRWEMYLRFETERVATLARLFTKSASTPAISISEAAMQQKLLESLPKSLHSILDQYGSLTTEEKQYYYRKGFVDSKRFIQSCAENYPERLSSILCLKGDKA